jgi:hypothetical protein
VSNNGQPIPKALKLTPAEVLQLKSALTRVTVYDLWRLIALPGYRQLPNDPHADYSCLSPLREENKQSFSIFDEGRRWKDHGDNTGADFNHGDCVDFLVRATGMDSNVAIRIIIAIDSANGDEDFQASKNGHNPFTDQTKAAERSSWPRLEIPTPDEITKIADLRNLSQEGVKAAANKGFLHCAKSSEGRAWVITDKTRYLAQIRRLDGKPWANLGGAKAKSLKGSIGTWPIGLKEAANHPAIALVEGGPDLLAAIDLIVATNTEAGIAPMAILGSSMAIAEMALPLFAGKRVKIFAHADSAGIAAGRRWAEQLGSVALEVTGYSFDGLNVEGRPVSDLNDFALRISQNPTAEAINQLSEAFNI